MTQSDCGHYRVRVRAQGGAIVREEEFTSYVAALSYFLQQAEVFVVENMAVQFEEREGREWIPRIKTFINDGEVKAEFGMAWLKARAEELNDGIDCTLTHYEPHL